MMIDYQFFSQDAEQAVIGGLLMDNRLVPDVIEILTSNDFAMEKHQMIFTCIESLADRGVPIDPIILADELGNNLEKAGGLPYLAEMAHNTPSTVNTLAYAQTVLDKRKERDVMRIAQEMKNIITGDGKSADKINSALALPTNINLDTAKERTANQILKQCVHDIDERVNSPSGLIGLDTGFEDINKRSGGLVPGNLIILASRPGMGKTTLALNIVQNTYSKGEGSAVVFSMEMSADELMMKMIASAGKIYNTRLRDGTLEEGDYLKLNTAVLANKDKSLVIDDRPGLTPQQLRAKCLREKRKHGSLKLIIVDYLQLMTTNNRENRTTEVSEISRSLKALAKEMDCPVIALSQLNRSVENRSDKRPLLSDLRESGSIEQDADIIWFLYRDEYYNKDNSNYKGVAELITAKFRNGETGSDFLKTRLSYSKFENLSGDWSQPDEQKATNFSLN